MTQVIESQSLFDIAVQESGSFLAAFELAVLNNISITDTLTPGQIIETKAPLNKEVYDYFKSRQLQVATALKQSQEQTQQRGIGFMRIGVDFKVS